MESPRIIAVRRLLLCVAAAIAMLLSPPRAAAQSLLLLSDEDESMEQLMETDPSANWDDELEELAALAENKIDINTATREQLSVFPFLTDMQIENLHYYIYRYGAMRDLNELRMVYGFDFRTIELLKPYVMIGSGDSGKHYPRLKNILRGGRHEVLSRLDVPFYRRAGYADGSYLGTPQYASLKYSFSYGDYLQAGFVGEKDAGETFFAANNRNGFDHYSAYISVSELGLLKRAVLGSYRMSFGQGLVLNSGFRIGKTFSMSTSDHRATGIRRHSSSDEVNYFNGLAATVRLMRNVELSAFFSRRERDAITEEGMATSIQSTGMHRTQTEIDRRGALAVQTAGGNLTWNSNRVKIGATGLWYGFDKELSPALSGYRRYNMHGKSFHNVSIDYALRLGRLQIAGEGAKGKEGYALLNRMVYSPTNDYQLALLHRYYSEDYWSFYGRSFGEGSTPQNENGWYAAVQASPIAHWQFFASVDLFSFPWQRYRISKASQGQDLMFQSRYTPTENLSMYLNYRYKRKERDVSGTGGQQTLPTHHHKFRYRLTCSVRGVDLQTTADYNVFNQISSSNGYQLTQKATVGVGHLPLTLTLQGTYFNTDDYDSRVYVYERGLLYTYSSASYAGEGFRGSAHLRLDLGKTLMLIAKLGCTHYTDRNEISSGHDLIKGSTKTDLQLQMRLKL